SPAVEPLVDGPGRRRRRRWAVRAAGGLGGRDAAASAAAGTDLCGRGAAADRVGAGACVRGDAAGAGDAPGAGEDFRPTALQAAQAATAVGGAACPPAVAVRPGDRAPRASANSKSIPKTSRYHMTGRPPACNGGAP